MTERHPTAEPDHTHKTPAAQPAPAGHSAADLDAGQVPALAEGAEAARLATPRPDARGNSQVRAAAALQLQRQLGNRTASRMLQRRASPPAAPPPGAVSTPAVALPPGLLGGGGLPGALLTDPRLAGRESQPVRPGAARQLQRAIGAAPAESVLQGMAGSGGLAIQRKISDLPSYSGKTGRPGSVLRRLVDQVNAYNDLAREDQNFDRQLVLLTGIETLIDQYTKEKGGEAKAYIEELGSALTPEKLHVQNRQFSLAPAPVRRGPPPLPADFKPRGLPGASGGLPGSVASVASSSVATPTPTGPRLPPPLPAMVPSGDVGGGLPLALPRPPPGRAGRSKPDVSVGGGLPLTPLSPPLSLPSSSAPRESKHAPVVSGGDVERPQAYEGMAPVRMFGDVGGGGSGTNIQKAFRRLEALLKSGGYAKTITVEQQIAVSTLVSALSDAVDLWEDTPPSAKDQIALLSLIEAVTGGSSGGVTSALAGLGIEIPPAEPEEEEAKPDTPPSPSGSPSPTPAPAADPYLVRQNATLARLNQEAQDELKKHGASGVVARADREVKIEKVEAKAKTAVKTAVGVGLGFVPVPGVSQAYSLALAVNQVRSTLSHINNLKKIRRNMLASGHQASDAPVQDLDYIIGKKNQRAIRSGVGGVPIVGTAKTAALAIKGVYKSVTGTKGVHRQQIAARLRAAAKLGDTNAQQIILELVGADQYNAALTGRAGADLIMAKMAST